MDFKKYLKYLKLLKSLILYAYFYILDFLTVTKMHKSKDGKNIIPITFALDDGYLTPTIIAMTSICINANEETYYELYSLVPDNFTNTSIAKLRSIGKQFPEHCNISIINMKKMYQDTNATKRFTVPTYYRLSIPTIFPQYDRMIYLDGDIICRVDLTEMLNLNMYGRYILGHSAFKLGDLTKFKIKDTKLYICAGVVLMDLKRLREFDFEGKALYIINHNKSLLEWHDQTLMNVILAHKIGLFPPEYGIYNYRNIDAIISRTNYTLRKKIEEYIPLEDLIDAYYAPKLVHYNMLPKPWKYNFTASYGHEFWHYARLSPNYIEFFNEFKDQFHREDKKQKDKKAREKKKQKDEEKKREKDKEERLKKRKEERLKREKNNMNKQ